MTVDTARYVRISEDKAGDAHGVVSQAAATSELCERRGWASELYSDNDLSATKGAHRPQYARLLRDVEEGHIGRIVVFHLSRLWRNRKERANGIELFKRHSIAIECVKGPSMDMSTAYGRGMAAMLGEFDTMEVEIKQERQMIAIADRARKGLPSAGGRRAFGFIDGKHIDPNEAQYIPGLFEKFNSGASLAELCRWLNGFGVTTTRGNPWTVNAMRALIQNPKYAGLRGVKWIELDGKGNPVLGATGEPKRMKHHEVTSKAVWPEIVSEAQWRAALQRLGDPSRRSHDRGTARKHLLPGVAECALCGARLKSSIGNRDADGNWASTLACSAQHHMRRLARPIEDYVVDVVCERLRRPDAISLVSSPSPGVDIGALSTESSAIRERLRVISADEVLGRRTRDEVVAAREAANGRLAEIDSVLAKAVRRDVVAEFVLSGEDPHVMWDSLPLSTRRSALRQLTVIRVGAGKIGRPHNDAGRPPANVFVEWREPL